EEIPINFKSMKECQEHEKRWIRPDVLGRVLNIPDIIRIKNHSEVLQNLHQLASAYERRDADFPLIQKSLSLKILDLLIKGLEANQNSNYFLHESAMNNTVTYIMENYNRPISLEQLSKLACLSVYHFSRLFKQRFGQSPHQFVIRYRMDRAKDMMICTQT